MSRVSSVAEAKELLAADKETALVMIGKVNDDDLENRRMSAPWSPSEKILGLWLLAMAEHLSSHKSQLFYYLKRQGVSANTGLLWGM